MPRKKQTRPVWVHAQRAHRRPSARQVFIGERLKHADPDQPVRQRLAEAHSEWSAATGDMQLEAQKKAQSKRCAKVLSHETLLEAEIKRLKSAPTTCASSPWGIGSSEFPLTETCVSDAMSGRSFLASSAQEWSRTHGERPPPQSFSERGSEERTACHCRGPRRFCTAMLQERRDLPRHLDRIKQTLRIIFAPRGTDVLYGRLASLKCGSVSMFIECVSARKTPFEAEFVMYEKVSPGAPFSVTMCWREDPIAMPAFLDEDELALRMLNVGDAWNFSILQYKPSAPNPAGFALLEILGEERVDVDTLFAAERAMLAAKRTMSLLRKHREGVSSKVERAKQAGRRSGDLIRPCRRQQYFVDDMSEHSEAGELDEVLDAWQAASHATEQHDAALRECIGRAESSRSSGSRSDGHGLEEKPGGGIYRGSKCIGKINVMSKFTKGTMTGIQVVCNFHVGCRPWVNLREVPDLDKLKVWLAMQEQFTNADQHKAAFKTIVCGTTG